MDNIHRGREMFDNQYHQSELKALLNSAEYLDRYLYEDPAIDPDYRLMITEVLDIEWFISWVLSNNQPGFKLVQKKIVGTGVPMTKDRLVSTPLADVYLRLVSSMFSALSPDYRYSPYVELFRDSVIELGMGWEQLYAPLAISPRTGKAEYLLFNELIELIREKAKSSDFKARLKRLKELAAVGYASVSQYINGLFKQHSKLLVLRLDLGYHSACTLGISLDQAKKDLAHLFNNLKKNKTLSEHRVGYIWRLEFGVEKGYHFHCLFFYNGQTAWKDEYWAMQLGEYWRNTIAPGRGQYWNVNTEQKKEEYRRKNLLGIGMIHRDDEDLRGNLLEHVAQYFFKMEQHVLAKTLENERGRLFGKGELT